MASADRLALRTPIGVGPPSSRLSRKPRPKVPHVSKRPSRHSTLVRKWMILQQTPRNQNTHLQPRLRRGFEKRKSSGWAKSAFANVFNQVLRGCSLEIGEGQPLCQRSPNLIVLSREQTDVVRASLVAGQQVACVCMAEVSMVHSACVSIPNCQDPQRDAGQCPTGVLPWTTVLFWKRDCTCWKKRWV